MLFHLTTNILLVLVVVIIAAASFFGTTVNVAGSVSFDPIYKGSSTDKVCLMINVYWGSEYIHGFLEIFKKYNVQCTFFVGGAWAAKHTDILQTIAEQGHELGNHGYFHKQHSKLSYQQNVEEMVACSKLVFAHCGVFPTLFAPPSGDFGKQTLQAAADNGFRTIMWSRDTIDWRDKDSQLVYTRATKNAQGGDLILMHPTSHTLQALEKIVQYYLNKNIRPVTVGEMLGTKWTSSNNIQAG